MPFALTIGVPYELFFKLTPNKLPSFYKSYKQKQKIIDEQMYYQGLYNLTAFEVVISHFSAGLSGKKSNAKYLEKPIMSNDVEVDNLTQEEHDRRELQKMIFAEEMWAKQHKRKGLPETVIL